MPLLSEIRNGAWSGGTARRAANGIDVTPLLYDGERGVAIQLDCEVTCVFNPSSFDNNGRLSVTFAIDQDTVQRLREVEAAVSAVMGIRDLHSNVKVKDGYQPGFKVKYDPDRPEFSDQAGPTEAPADWRGLRLKIMVSPRSVYHQRTMQGITWELVAVRILGSVEKKPHEFV